MKTKMYYLTVILNDLKPATFDFTSEIEREIFVKRIKEGKWNCQLIQTETKEEIEVETSEVSPNVFKEVR